MRTADRLVLEDVRDHPDPGEVGHRVERGLRHDPLLGEHVALHDEAGDGRGQREVLQGHAGSGDFGDLLLADVPQLHALFGGGHQVFRAAQHFVHRVVVHHVLRFDGQQILLLGGQRFRTVDGEQRVALVHLLAGEIDEHLVDPSFQLAVHFGDLGFVQRHARHGADGALHGLVLHRAVFHADELLLFGRDLHAAFGQFVGAPLVARLFAGVDRDQLHVAIGRDAGDLALVPGVHRVHPIERLALTGGRLGVPAAVTVAAGPGRGHENHYQQLFHNGIPVISSRRAIATWNCMTSSWYMSSYSTTFMKLENSDRKSSVPV